MIPISTVEEAGGVAVRALPMRPGGAVLALYLAVAVIPLAAGGLAGGRSLALLAHLVALAAVVGSELRRASGTAGVAARVFADLHLLLLLPLLYAELPLLIEGMPGAVLYRDPTVQAWEAALLGFQPAWELAARLPSLWLSEVVHVAYLSYYLIIYVPPFLLLGALLKRGRNAAAVRESEFQFQYAIAALALSMAFCYVIFIAWPVQGPRYLGVPAGIPDGPVRAFTLSLLETGSSRGAAFPSSHVAISVTQTLVMLRFRRAVGIVMIPLTALLALGAVYGGFHYAIDTLVGALFGGAAVWAAGPLSAAFGRSGKGFAPAPDPV